MKHFDALVDLLSFIMVCAPNKFPKRDFWADDEQWTLDRVFDEARHGMQFVPERVSDPAVLPLLHAKLEESYQAYKSGEKLKGAHLIQDFERDLIAATSRRHARRTTE